jgi:hypothetical protein
MYEPSRIMATCSHDLNPILPTRGGHPQDHHIGEKRSGHREPHSLRTAPVVTDQEAREHRGRRPIISRAMSPRAPNAVKRQISRIVTCSESTGYTM